MWGAGGLPGPGRDAWADGTEAPAIGAGFLVHGAGFPTRN
jgi:hypothetical protein